MNLEVRDSTSKLHRQSTTGTPELTAKIKVHQRKNKPTQNAIDSETQMQTAKLLSHNKQFPANCLRFLSQKIWLAFLFKKRHANDLKVWNLNEMNQATLTHE